ncbi:MAG TPA: nucleoside deaminase [Bacteroidales bacterium]|nr:nucleoside deaminase [Bacteroidales bacterium]HPI86626.1 nucleoside deaminase [Bacteroidales bacterium]HPM92243.1 nucleoside deaminase [Bacteroidales bacterium]
MSDEQNREFMEEAIRLAALNMDATHGGPFGCVIVKDGRIIASAYNEVLRTNDPTAHAEIVAIRRACEKLNSYQLAGCEIFTSCEPCPMCLGAIYWSRPAKVYYAASRKDAEKAGFDDNHIYQEVAVPDQNRVIPFEQFMPDKVVKLFQQWVQLKRDVNY